MCKSYYHCRKKSFLFRRKGENFNTQTSLGTPRKFFIKDYAVTSVKMEDKLFLLVAFFIFSFPLLITTRTTLRTKFLTFIFLPLSKRMMLSNLLELITVTLHKNLLP